MNEVIINSFIAGTAQSFIGHPFDTIKTYKQISPSKNINFLARNLIKRNGIFYLYRGFFPSLLGGCMQNSLIFSTENYFKNLCNNNSYVSGFLSGTLTSLIISPSELVKTRMQINKRQTVYEILKNTRITRGLWLTFLRDSFGFSVYFGTYNYFQNKYDNPLINGGISGVLSWIYTYPLDVLKTKHQISNNTLKSVIKNSTFKQLTSGMSIMLVRSFFVNAGIFYIFENLKNHKKNN